MSATMLVCKVCGNTWLPRVLNPTRCADYKCQSRNWNKDLHDLAVEELREIQEVLKLRLTSIQTLYTETEFHVKEILNQETTGE